MGSNLNLNIDYDISGAEKSNIPYQLRKITEKIIENRVIPDNELYEIFFDKYITIKD